MMLALTSSGGRSAGTGVQSSLLPEVPQKLITSVPWAGSIPGGGRYEFESRGVEGVIPAGLPLGTRSDHSPLSHSGR